MQKYNEENTYVPQIGDIVAVINLTGAPLRGEVVGEFTISPTRAQELKEYYPDIKAGDKGYTVNVNGDTRNFFPSKMMFIKRKNDTPDESAADTAAARLEILKKKRPAKSVLKNKPF